LLAGCSPLSIINRWAPSDTYKLTSGIAYGPRDRNHLDVYVPVRAVGKAPVVVFFYGGNWNSGERGDYLFVGEALAARGFIVVIADYRLYPEVRFPDFLDDCALAVKWTLDHIAEHGGDTQRLFLMGHSAGAYNAAMLALNPQRLRNVGVDAAAIRGLIGLAGPYDFLPIQDEIARKVFGYPDTPRITQPIDFASRLAPRALLITGSNDDTVNPGNSTRLAERLRREGVSVKHIIYPDISHRLLMGSISIPFRRSAPTLKDVAAFIIENNI
jgi:acetyl esterase/lipase